MQARTLPKTVSITAAIVLVLLGRDLSIPPNFDMRAKGTLQPVKKHEVFAPMPGEVHGGARSTTATTVKEGELLVVMRNPDLEIKKQEVEGEFNAARESLQRDRQQLISPAARSSRDQERAQAEADQAKLVKVKQHLDKQLRAAQRARRSS